MYVCDASCDGLFLVFGCRCRCVCAAVSPLLSCCVLCAAAARGASSCIICAVGSVSVVCCVVACRVLLLLLAVAVSRVRVCVLSSCSLFVALRRYCSR